MELLNAHRQIDKYLLADFRTTDTHINPASGNYFKLTVYTHMYANIWGRYSCFFLYKEDILICYSPMHIFTFVYGFCVRNELTMKTKHA